MGDETMFQRYRFADHMREAKKSVLGGQAACLAGKHVRSTTWRVRLDSEVLFGPQGGGPGERQAQFDDPAGLAQVARLAFGCCLGRSAVW